MRHVFLFIFLFAITALAAPLPTSYNEVLLRTDAQFKSQGSAPLTPSAGYIKFYEKSNILYKLDSTATEKAIAADGQTPNFAGLVVGTLTGFLKATSGTVSAASSVSLTADVSGLLPLASGGSNANLTAVAGGVLWSDASKMQISAAGSSGQILQSTGTTAPSFTTATYPSTTTVSQLLYSSATNAVAGLATSNTATLITNGSGVPAWTAAATNGNVLRRSAGAISYGQIDLTDGTNAVTGALGIANGGSGQITANAALNAFLPTQTSNSNKYLKTDGTNTSWAAIGVGSLSVSAKTTTYAILTSDDVITCSGSAFTVTLPTAVGNTGKVFYIKKTDSSLANIITVATTSSQTIDGQTTRKLVTEGEMLVVVSDNANWQIVARVLPRITNTFTMTFAGGTPPTKGTVSVDLARWWREGNGMRITWTYKHTAAGTAGTSDYQLSVPGSQTIDSSVTSNSVYGQSLGSGWVHSNNDMKSNYLYHGDWFAYSTTTFGFRFNTQLSASAIGDVWKSGNTTVVSMDSTNVIVSMNIWVPITNWDQ